MVGGWFFLPPPVLLLGLPLLPIVCLGRVEIWLGLDLLVMTLLSLFCFWFSFWGLVLVFGRVCLSWVKRVNVPFGAAVGGWRLGACELLRTWCGGVGGV